MYEKCRTDRRTDGRNKLHPIGISRARHSHDCVAVHTPTGATARFQNLTQNLENETARWATFLSSSKTRLNYIKRRPLFQPCLITTTTFKTLKNLVRVPLKYKKEVRRAKKTTFIYQNKKAIRVVKDGYHYRFLKKFDYIYSTSANKTGKSFDEEFATSIVDIAVLDERSFSENFPSKLIKLSKSLKKKLR